ncbi:hypothetical protein CFC21_050971 [Triticum aestivum]|uniref:Uncharacterized protein n=2 Tax=Triticum aestivum TaxID=4565 RepID=A0A3B6HN29_WHEAT|nr:non-specific lipid transfer protein GPI-anchored 21-like [Triticum aestivum]XP_048572392.1 non-specific lipid transfer protein GPI-anchored 21-like [Triticum urartu]KAF7041143.1 hypothetical protein CFC21_050971 [Triticum aestivum]
MPAKYLQAFERRGDRSCTGVDCACRILTGNVPFGLPISRTLVISLPKVCKSLSVQLMCRDTATQIPAPPLYGLLHFAPGKLINTARKPFA